MSWIEEPTRREDSQMSKMSAKITILLGVAAMAITAAPALAQSSGVAPTGPAAAGESPGRIINLNYDGDGAGRFAELGLRGRQADRRGVALELAADGARAGVALDISIAPRASIGADSQGDIAREGQGAEVRVGQGLGQSTPRRDPRWYVFAASDDEALTWQPGARGEFGGRTASLSIQDRVEIGDMQAGVTYERGGVQASLAYVEREVSSTVGTQTISRDESFTGLTLTMRR